MATTRKVVLGKTPKSVKHVVTATLLDGETGAIECEYQYRTRRQFADLIDRLFDGAKSADGADEAPLTYGNLTRAGVEKNAAYLGEVLLGWNLDIELTPEALLQLCDEQPALAQAIMDSYRTACTEGRWGN